MGPRLVLALAARLLCCRLGRLDLEAVTHTIVSGVLVVPLPLFAPLRHAVIAPRELLACWLGPRMELCLSHPALSIIIQPVIGCSFTRKHQTIHPDV